MNADFFFDTNILVYAASTAPEDAQKRAKALEMIGTIEFGISGQVMAEFYNVTARKRKILDHHQALDWLEQMEELPSIPIDMSLVYQGAEISDRYDTSYWDGAMVAAAKRLGASTLYTEDLNHGQTYDGVRVCNPFIEDFLT